MKNKLLTELLFWLHLPIVIIWFGLFLVPQNIWPERVFFHFWYIAGIMAVQVLWALCVYRKIDIICPLTTWLQYSRGYPVKSKKNYAHSYIAELFERLHLKVSYKFINWLLLATLIIVAVQYFYL